MYPFCLTINERQSIGQKRTGRRAKQQPTGKPIVPELERLNEIFPAKKWGDTEIAERGRSVLVMRVRYRSAGLIPHQRGWTDAG